MRGCNRKESAGHTQFFHTNIVLFFPPLPSHPSPFTPLPPARGITLGETCVPEWVGYCVWVGCWMLVCTMVPLIEYFATYRVTMQMQRFGYFLGTQDP